MEGPKVFYVVCITVVSVVYANHYENLHRKNWRHSLDENPSLRFEHFDKDLFRSKSIAQPETTTTDSNRIQLDIFGHWTAPPALPDRTTTKAPIDSDKSWFLETYWETTDDEPKPSWRNSVIIPIIAEPKSKLPKARVAIIKSFPTVGYFRL